MKLKNIFFLSFLLSVLTINATEVEINLSKLKRTTPIFLAESGVLNRIPESGIVKINVEHLPTLVQIVSLAKSKIVTHKTIWLKGTTLAVEGTIGDAVEVTPNSAGEILPDNIEKKWQQFDLKKHPELGSSQTFLVYINNKLKFQKTEQLKQLIEQLPAEQQDFWAAQNIKSYLKSFDEVGFDSAKNQFEFFTGLDKEGKKQLYNRPKDKFLLIDFSTSSCKPCLMDIDKIVQLQKDFNDQLEIVSIWGDPKQEAWLQVGKTQKDKITWTNLRDESRAIFKKFEINVYPTYILVDKTGKVVKRWKGAGVDKVRKQLK